ncbi:MAG TPA: response regulator [Polyangiaceae bacterium]|nr:response regulator [Polyangiaceae bacterium]
MLVSAFRRMAEILLLEDDDEMREVLAAVVAAEGHRVLESATIADALERLTQATFDLAILDGQLPDGDGIDFARHLCLIQPQVKVIFLSSAWRDAKATNALRKLGVTEIIHKPVPPVELALRVARVLRSRTGLPAALSSAPERSAPQAFAPSRASAPPQASASSPVLSGHSRDDDGPALRAKPPDSERPTSSPPPVIPVTSSVPVSPAPLAERLTGLRLTYSERLTGKLTELADTLKQARARDGQRHMIERAEYLAHRLRGTAGTYGFMSVSLAAASIESALQVLQRSGDAEVVWRRIDEALQRAEHAQRTPPSSVMPAIRRQAMARVLVVDDDPECLAQLEVLGRAVSLDMIPTSDAAQALEIARREPIDLALVDMCLKGDETPFQLVKDLRGVDGRESLPVACMSANGSIKNRVAAVHAGATLFFEKPIDADELSAFTRRMLEAREAERARILILDDDPEAARGLARLLRGAGWLATTLSDVDRLFEVLGQVQPDLLLLDVMMPISGFDICKALRASPTWQELPVVFLTGATDRRTVVACYGVGGDDYVGKPILPEELLARVRMRIERSRMFRQRAHEDSLTGLLTRAAFSDVVEQRLA